MTTRAPRIGYQGDMGSNAEEAAQRIAKSLSFSAPEYLSLISSANVASALADGRIDYGVMAIRNSIGGEVIETREALLGRKFHVVGNCILEVHHCLFKLPAVPPESLSAIASHQQALKQTERNRKKLYPRLGAVEIEDTAIGARKLAAGELDSAFAVLCKESAGFANGLELVHRNLEDEQPSLTRFLMFASTLHEAPNQ